MKGFCPEHGDFRRHADDSGCPACAAARIEWHDPLWDGAGTYCPHCGGYGSSLKEAAARCTKCGGSGLLRKAE